MDDSNVISYSWYCPVYFYKVIIIKIMKTKFLPKIKKILSKYFKEKNTSILMYYLHVFQKKDSIKLFFKMVKYQKRRKQITKSNSICIHRILFAKSSRHLGLTVTAYFSICKLYPDIT